MTLLKDSSSNILSIRPFQFNPTQRVWITNEDHYLREHYKRLSVKEIAQYLRRSQSAVRTRAHKLGLKKITYTPWTEEEHKYLRVAYPTGDVEEIARKLNRTNYAIRKKACSLGLEKSLLSQMKRPKKLKRMKPREEPWEDDQLTFLKQQFSQMSLEEMSQRLQRPESEIRSKLRQIFPVSTRRPLFYKLLTAEVDKLRISGINTQFLQQKLYAKGANDGIVDALTIQTVNERRGADYYCPECNTLQSIVMEIEVERLFHTSSTK